MKSWNESLCTDAAEAWASAGAWLEQRAALALIELLMLEAHFGQKHPVPTPVARCARVLGFKIGASTDADIWLRPTRVGLLRELQIGFRDGRSVRAFLRALDGEPPSLSERWWRLCARASTRVRDRVAGLLWGRARQRDVVQP